MSYIFKSDGNPCRHTGDKFYYSDGTTSERRDDEKVLHREDGPAVELIGGGKFWYVNGSPHRLDGPAVEYGPGGKEWWIDGRPFYTEEQHAQVIEEVRNIPLELKLTDPRNWVRKFKND